MKKIVISFILVIFTMSIFAQTIDDVLRYSKTNLSGTARYVAMGGAFGALGGDISAINTNPAAAGVFVYSEMNISPTFYHSHSESEFMNNLRNDGRFNFNLNNIGMLGTAKLKNEDWKSISYAFSYDRLGNYYNRIYNEGSSTRSSSSSRSYGGSSRSSSSRSSSSRR